MTNHHHHDQDHNNGPRRPILEALLKGAAEGLTIYLCEHGGHIAATCTAWIHRLLM